MLKGCSEGGVWALSAPAGLGCCWPGDEAKAVLPAPRAWRRRLAGSLCFPGATPARTKPVALIGLFWLDMGRASINWHHGTGTRQAPPSPPHIPSPPSHPTLRPTLAPPTLKRRWSKRQGTARRCSSKLRSWVKGKWKER